MLKVWLEIKNATTFTVIVVVSLLTGTDTKSSADHYSHLHTLLLGK